MKRFGPLPRRTRLKNKGGSRYPLVWYWKASWWRPIDRKGQRCRIVARGKKNTVAVEFPDGFWTITSGWAVRRLTPSR